MKRVLLLLVGLALIFAGCTPGDRIPPVASPYIERHPKVMQFPVERISVMPSFDSANPQEIHLWARDLTGLGLENRLDDLLKARFDTRTVWPSSLPSSFNPSKIIELGKNPGLGVRGLHKKGITGQDVSIAIIDDMLLVDHVEYKDRIAHYEEVYRSSPFLDENKASMHGAAVASLAVGKSIGTAPGAVLYYFATSGSADSLLERDTDALERVVEFNKTLPDGKKIRVVSLSAGWQPDDPALERFISVANEAKSQGMLVLTARSLYDNFNLFGLDRDFRYDPDKLSSYGPSFVYRRAFLEPDARYSPPTMLLVPQARTVAGFLGTEDYWISPGGPSWCVPYVAGLYALACQVKPSVTPEEFLRLAMETGDTRTIEFNGQTHDFGVIVNPVRLIEALRDK